MRRVSVVLGTAALAGAVSCSPQGKWHPREDRAQVVEEIAATDVFRFPTADPTCSAVAYLHRGPRGRELCVLELNGLERRRMNLTNEATRIREWSEDGRFLVFLQSPFAFDARFGPGTGDSKRESWATLYEPSRNSIRRLTDDSGVMELSFAWLDTNRFLLSRQTLGRGRWELCSGALNSSALEKVCERKTFVLISSDRIAYAEDGELFSLDLKVFPTNAHEKLIRRAVQLSSFKTNGFDEIRWPNYSRQTGRFLFCARPGGCTWRYLYQFDPRSGELEQLTDEDTYNGQWLQKGRGFVCVGNADNHFYLKVRPAEPAGHTNLFTEGSVDHYSVGPDGQHIYAVASLGMEPQGIWEYDLGARALRQLVAGTNKPFAVVRIAEPEEYRIRSFDGLPIPCFLFRPVSEPSSQQSRAKADNGQPPDKHPAIIYLPPPSLQFQRAFKAESQLFANLGFYFLAVNCRGCDGYGRDYSELGNGKEQAADVLAAYEDLMRNPGVDRKNVFLYGTCGGVATVLRLLAEKPERWRAVALRHGVGASFEGLQRGKLPPVLLSIGDHDLEPAWLERFQAWQRANKGRVEFLVHTNSDHNGYIYRAAEEKVMLSKLSKFFLENVR